MLNSHALYTKDLLILANTVFNSCKKNFLNKNGL